VSRQRTTTGVLTHTQTDSFFHSKPHNSLWDRNVLEHSLQSEKFG